MFADIKVGDVVVVSGRENHMAPVTKVVPTRFVVGHYVFRKSDGGIVAREKYDSFFRPVALRIATAEDFAKRDLLELQRKTRSALEHAAMKARGNSWSADYCERVLALLKEAP